VGVRNRSKETLRRLAAKTLDARFLHEIEHGLNCSPFEGGAVLQVVKEVYFPFLDADLPLGPPGKITLIAVSAEEPVAKLARPLVSPLRRLAERPRRGGEGPPPTLIASHNRPGLAFVHPTTPW